MVVHGENTVAVNSVIFFSKAVKYTVKDDFVYSDNILKFFTTQQSANGNLVMLRCGRDKRLEAKHLLV